MSFLTHFKSRYTTKNYTPNLELDESKIHELKEVLRLSPSSINSQPWQFTFVMDSGVKQQLSEVSWLNGDRIKNGYAVIVFSRENDLDIFEARIKKDLPEGAFNYYVEFIKPLPKEEIFAWMEKQVYLALGVFLSACSQMGIDSTPMEGIEPEAYDDILGQETYATIVAVTIGSRTHDDFNQPHLKPKARRELSSVIKTI